MNRRSLLTLWGVFFILCAGLGFIPEPADSVRLLLTALSVLSFAPPALLIWQGKKTGDRAVLKLVRSLSTASLSLTALLLILNFLTVFHSEVLGTILYGILVVVSSPMICSGHWAMSLFFWACLLIASLK